MDIHGAATMVFCYGDCVTNCRAEHDILLVLYGGDIMVIETLSNNWITAGVLGQTYDYSIGESYPEEVQSI